MANTMQNIKPLLLIFLLPLTGCPAPAYYSLVNTQTNHAGCNTCQVDIKNVHPWRDTKKKTVSVYTTITNTSTTDKATFVISDATLQTTADSFYLNYTNKDLVNGRLMNEETVILEPGMKKEVPLYFLSKKNYSGPAYKRSIERDTLLLTINGKQWRLAGNWGGGFIFL
jgi:hypothetical protein